MSGGELFDIVADKGRLSEQQASQVVRDIIIGVEYLHSCDVVHCDIKPENILCKTDQWPLEVKLCDFGLSNFIDRKVANAEGDENTMSAMIGTPGVRLFFEFVLRDWVEAFFAFKARVNFFMSRSNLRLFTFVPFVP